MSCDVSEVHRNCQFIDPKIEEGDKLSLLKVAHPTRDHIIPRVAIADHKRIFRELGDGPRNLLPRVCEFHHDIIDAHKIGAYNDKGTVGLVGFVASYPRVNDPRVLGRQYEKWLAIFGVLKSSLTEFDLYRSSNTGQHKEAAKLAKRFWERWRDGGIDEFIQTGVTDLKDRNGLRVSFNSKVPLLPVDFYI